MNSLIVTDIMVAVVDRRVVACSLDGLSFYEMQAGEVSDTLYYVGLEEHELIRVDLKNMLIGEGGLLEPVECGCWLDYIIMEINEHLTPSIS